jgi:hypothetical protein
MSWALCCHSQNARWRRAAHCESCGWTICRQVALLYSDFKVEVGRQVMVSATLCVTMWSSASRKHTAAPGVWLAWLLLHVEYQYSVCKRTWWFGGAGLPVLFQTNQICMSFASVSPDKLKAECKEQQLSSSQIKICDKRITRLATVVSTQFHC